MPAEREDAAAGLVKDDSQPAGERSATQWTCRVAVFRLKRPVSFAWMSRITPRHVLPMDYSMWEVSSFARRAPRRGGAHERGAHAQGFHKRQLPGRGSCALHSKVFFRIKLFNTSLHNPIHFVA